MLLLALLGPLVGIAGCVKDAPLPQPGACADLPEGVYEYGQMGIGTCLAGPTDLAFLDGGRVLAVSNANPWKDFTGGSALFLDLSTVDYSLGRNVIAPDATSHPDAEGVSARAVGLPSFAGAMDYVPARDLLLVTNRLSDGARTREEADAVWFVDVSDPDAPGLADLGPDGPWVETGWDPNAVHYDAGSDIAWVLNRTSHTVSMLDMSADPVALLPPGGPTRLDAGTFDDVDASGSRAGFVQLDSLEEPDPGAHTWSLGWGIGTVRVWVPDSAGAYRVTGNGESLWTRSNVPDDVDLDAGEGQILAVNDPDFSLEDGFGRMVFEDQGVLRAADAPSTLESWVFEADPLLEPGDGWDTDLGGPTMLTSGATWYLFYDGGNGGDHAVGLATSVDGVSFVRSGSDAVLAEDGASLTDPFVMWDDQAAQWRMFYTVDGAAIGQAVSDDLLTWTAQPDRFAPAGGAANPTVSYYNGRFHLFYTRAGTDGTEVAEASSIDGSTWTELGAPFPLDAGSLPDGSGVALQVVREEAFGLRDQGGAVLPETLTPGELLPSSTGGWEVRVAVGQGADPDDVGAASLSLDSLVGTTAYLTYTGDDGTSSIGMGERVDDDLVLDPTPVLEAGAAGGFDADSVSSPVVTTIGGEQVMYYAGTALGVTSIGRATSTDGVTWAADETPVLTPAADWESVGIEPGSVQVLDDGTVRIWYSAYDGSHYRIGLAESADGVTFTRVAGTEYDWVFDAGAPGDWYDSGVRHPYVIRDGDIDRMWFAGFSGESWQLGYAERSGDDAEWTTAVDGDGSERPVLAGGLGGFGVGGVTRPIVAADGDGWEVWYTGLDDDQGRVGRAVASDPDRLHRDLRMPTLADTWSFTSVPAREGDNLPLDVVIDGSTLLGEGCSTIAQDDDRGFLYVGCKLVPYVYVIDIRDDSTDTFDDLNYLDVETVIVVETSTGADSGLRSLVMDRTRGWLWGVADEPEAIYAIDVSTIPDDADTELLREDVVSMLPLPRAGEHDEGVDTQSSVGPAQIALHPDGRHLLVTNFNGNSVSAYDLGTGATGTLVAQTEAVGENPYAIRISDDGTLAAVGNYTGEVDGDAVSSTIALLDADPTSPTFLKVKTWLVNK